MRKIQKYILFTFIILIVLACLLEFLSWLFFTVRHDRFTFADPEEFVINDADIARIAKSFHPVLGWKTTFKTSHGQRPQPVAYDEDIMATFGDSYTFCAEVNDDETWQSLLAQQFAKNIYNFGNGGYGVDQSYLRFKEDFPRVKTPLVVLGLITENFNRIASGYRKFYIPSTGIPATKPRFAVSNGRLTLIENPIQHVEDLVKLKDKLFIEELSRDDFWFNQAGRPRFKFPFSALFLQKNIRNELRHGKSGDATGMRAPVILKYPFDQKEYRLIMYAILDSFVSDARTLQAVPIVLYLPDRHDLEFRIKNGVNIQPMQALIEFCRVRQYHIYSPIDDFLREIKLDQNIVLFTRGGHYTAKGNSILAKNFHDYIKDKW
jgi:hypothetical protein